MVTINQRYNKLLKKYTNVGTDPSQRGQPYPTMRQLNAFEKYNIIPDIDFELRDLIIELNSKGYITEGSCSGHSTKSNGFIFFNFIPTQYKVNKIVNILKSYGLANLKFENHPKAIPQTFSILFKPVGIHTPNPKSIDKPYVRTR